MADLRARAGASDPMVGRLGAQARDGARVRARRRFSVMAAMVLIVAACSGDGGAETTSTTTSSATATSTTTTTSTSPPALAPDVDRLVVLDGRNRVVTLARDGSETTVLSRDGEVPFQPVWSPDAADIAYSDRSSAPAFVVVGADGESRRSVSNVTPSFYFFWSPDGARLGSLRNGALGIAFEVIDVQDDSVEVSQVDNGQPFYFSWSPDGDRAVAHVGADRLDLLDGAGGTEPLGASPGAFQAPQWTPSGIYAAIRRGGGQEIVRIDAAGTTESIVSAEGSVIFSASPGGNLIAAQTFVAGEGGVSVALLADPLPPNRLHVIDVAAGSVTPVLDRPAAGFFWSPVLDRLLVLESTDEAGVAQWSVWDDGALTDGPRFRPAPQWIAEFLPFYDQYNQSVSLWAPDASAYAFPGAIDGEAGIFVALPGGGEPQRVSDGSWVAWSPR